ncbi:hypothetical protein NECAME_09858 [Necator americanus]|uniref:E2F-associated phosphoprotein n=1 Tax=Necator americanus TaxID=51031 RepID=W2TBF4_NECAM|nr:hypothetical protein NECAME_09858 [Necator americanus]ETN79360.1 hypothetical protein NECAME_09858 [Necator americanus]
MNENILAVPSEFEMDMEYELDQLITDYANEHLSGNRKREEDVKKVSAKEFVEQCQEDEMPELIGSDDDEEEEVKQNDQPDSTESVPSKKQRLDEVTTVIDTPKSENMDIEEGMTEAGPSSSTEFFFRAMFVENCRVEQESFKIEKTGKERRRERQKMKKMGMDPNEQPSAQEDMFLPVHCAVCSTNVAVMDHEEVYHFFNVLSGYA